MGGVRIGGTAQVILPPEPEPDVVFLVNNSDSSQYEIWRAGNNAAPVEYLTAAISNSQSANDYLADPAANSDQTFIVWSRVGYNLTPKKQSVMKTDWDDTSATELYSETDSTNLSLQPTWAPDGSKILFRSHGAVTGKNLIKTMDPDGTNVTTLYTGAAAVQYPTYSPDGTKIVFTEGALGAVLKVMDADGSNVATLRTPSGFYSVTPGMAWTSDSATIAFAEKDAVYTQDFYWMTVNADGTGLTTILTVNRSSGYGPSDVDPYPIEWSWLPDDSALVTSRQVPADPDPDHILTTIMADGSGYVDFSPERRQTIGTPDGRPAVFGTRVYYLDGDANGLASIKLDGTDKRTDFDVTDTTFHGFRGDTINT